MVKKRAWPNTMKEEILYALFYAYSAIPGTISAFFSCGERSETVILLTGTVPGKQSPVRAYLGCGGRESREMMITDESRDYHPLFPGMFSNRYFSRFPDLNFSGEQGKLIKNKVRDFW